MRYDHARWEEQAAAVGMGGVASEDFESAPNDYYTLRLRALSDGVFLDVVFLPLSPPGDLIDMAAQLSNQRLMCVLEACHLGGASTELVLSRAYRLNH
ncbi:hypothetical protein OYC64_001140 [Pagothenia borchgrevinki]|uniref:Uncharacterized protein n=1 Tax=Pagothenia borchgrevinki TaxID=8213 RepID=A0ABD2GA86_PAGBO